MIKSLLLAGSALVVLAGSSFAADLPSRRAPPVYVPPVPVFTWTGIYVGGQVGYEFGRSSFLYGGILPGVYGAAYRPDGVVGGAHVGYNWSSQSLFGGIPGLGNLFGAGGVVGIEGDVNGSNYNRTVGVIPGVALGTRTNIDGSIRGRLGFAVDRALFYATGGAAFADLRNSYLNTGLGVNTNIGHTRVGYTVGGGIEYAVTNNWSVRAEYRYTDYGSYTDFPYAAVAVRHRETDNRVQVGFSYKFDTFNPPVGPVVAKY